MVAFRTREDRSDRIAIGDFGRPLTATLEGLRRAAGGKIVLEVTFRPPRVREMKSCRSIPEFAARPK